MRFVLSAFLTCALLSVTPASRAMVSTGAQDVGWRDISPTREEFKISFPAAPNVTEGSRFFYTNHQLLVPFRIYRLFAAGTLFTVESYDAPRPRDLVTFLWFGRRSAHTETDIEINGLKGKTFLQEVEGLFFKGEYIVGRKHVYFVEAARRGTSDPAIDQFFGSLSFHEGEPNPRDPKMFAAALHVDGPVFPARELTNKAIILAKLLPKYTDEGRERMVNGTVVLEAVLRASGEVSDIKVRTGLPYGLTEQAIEATRSIVFIPGEKDGAPVSQRVIVEYNFSIY